MVKRTYPLDLENIGGDIYSLMSKGHHDPHDFMRQARTDGYEWPLGMPKHIWLRCIPPPEGYSTWYVEAKEGARGAFPATQCWEAGRDETYEAIVAAGDSPAAQGADDPLRLPCTCPSGDGSLRWHCPTHPPAPVASSEVAP